MIIIYPDGRVQEVQYTDYTGIEKAVNAPGKEDAFTAVPLPERHYCGYSVYVNDVGEWRDLPVNTFAERLCDYTPLLGPAVIVSFEEADETDLIGEIRKEARDAFKQRLDAAVASARQFEAKSKSASN